MSRGNVKRNTGSALCGLQWLAAVPSITLAAAQPCDRASLLQVQPTEGLGAIANTHRLVDITSDAIPDLLLTADHQVHVLIGAGDGTFSPWTTIPAGLFAFGLVSGDFDANGEQDIAVVVSGEQTLKIYLQAAGTFSLAATQPLGADPRLIECGDLDADGHVDLAVSGFGSDQLLLSWGNGDGTFFAGPHLPAGTRPNYLRLADLNGDGIKDIVACHYESSDIQVWLNQGGRAFASQPRFATGTQPRGLVVADLDEDGDLDLATSNFASGDVRVHWNDGSASFPSQATITTGIGAHHLQCDDFDGDGRLDLLLGNAGPRTLSFIPGKLGSGFDPRIDFALPYEPGWLATARLGTGPRPSILMQQRFTANLALVENGCPGVFAPRLWHLHDGGNGNTYQAIWAPNGITWTEASAAATAAGGHLATLTTAPERNWADANVSSTSILWRLTGNQQDFLGPWIGGFQDMGAPGYAEPAGGWAWVTGEPFASTAWATAEPNNARGIEDYLVLFSKSGQPGPLWNDYPDDDLIFGRPLGYLIEYPRCPADLTGSSDAADPSHSIPDGDADSDDFFYFLDAFAEGMLAICDLTGSSDPNEPSFGQPDGDCDGDDFFYYLGLFQRGCD